MPAPLRQGTQPINDMVVDVRPNQEDPKNKRQKQLVSWVIAHIEPWERYRDNNYETLWKEYYRSWKGVWDTAEKTRTSERSKFISPALQQAVEMGVAEAEEATFGRQRWIDIDDDLRDADKTDMALVRDQLLEDMELNGVPEGIAEAYLNGAIYGTGIGKVVVSEQTEIVTDEQGYSDEQTYTKCELEPISPEDFCIDPEARTIDEALGCAHIIVVPKHGIEKKQAEGIYEETHLGDYADDRDLSSKGETKSDIVNDKCEIVEYHGLVPTYLLPEEDDDMPELIP